MGMANEHRNRDVLVKAPMRAAPEHENSEDRPPTGPGRNS